MIALSGVRSSCDMLARNSLLCRLAASSCRLLSSISRKSRAFWMASADCVAKVFSRSITSGANSPARLPVDDQAAEQVVLAQQRHGQERSVAQPDEDLADAALVAALVRDVADLHRLAGHRHPPERTLALADRRGPQRRRPARRAGGPSRAGGTPRAPRRTRRSRRRPCRRAAVARETIVREHGLEVERRADRLPDLAQRLAARPPTASARAVRASQLLEQPHVLDRDHRLVGEGLQQLDLLVGERPGLGAADGDRADRRCPRASSARPGRCGSRRRSAASPIAYSGSVEHVGDVRRRAASGSRAADAVSRLERPRIAGGASVRRLAAFTPSSAARWTSSPSKREDVAELGAAQLAARSRRSCRTPAARRSASWLITRRISLVAVCCSSASVRSRLRASSSVNSRTFSIAITAWSAKVCSSAICVVGKRPGLRPADDDRADRLALAQHRHGEDAAEAAPPATASASPYSGSASTSGIATTPRVEDRPARRRVAAGRPREQLRDAWPPSVRVDVRDRAPDGSARRRT